MISTCVLRKQYALKATLGWLRQRNHFTLPVPQLLSGGYDKSGVYSELVMSYREVAMRSG